jgi:signal peptidase I
MRKTEEYNITLSEEKVAPKKKILGDGKLNVFEVFQAIISALVVITILFTFVFRVVNVDGT